MKHMRKTVERYTRVIFEYSLLKRLIVFGVDILENNIHAKDEQLIDRSDVYKYQLR